MSNKNPPFATGENIRSLRLLKGLKQTEAGRKLGIGQQAYSKIECSAGISETKTLKILKAFESSKEELDQIAQFLPPPPLVINNRLIGLHDLFFQRLLFLRKRPLKNFTLALLTCIGFFNPLQCTIDLR